MEQLKRLGRAPIPTGQTKVTVYTVPVAVGSYALLKSLSVVNTTGSTIHFWTYAVPSGQSEGTSNILNGKLSLAGDETFRDIFNDVLAAGESLVIVASAEGLTITATGIEVTP